MDGLGENPSIEKCTCLPPIETKLTNCDNLEKLPQVFFMVDEILLSVK